LSTSKPLLPNIVFDLGNVLIHCDMDKAARMIKERSSLPHEVIRERLFDAELIDAWDVGELDPEAFTARVQQSCEWEGSMSELEEIWQQMLHGDPRMFEVFDELVEAGHDIYILSNANPFHIEYVMREHPQLLQAQGHIFSCECRMIKPQVEIFHHLTEKYSLEPERSIFIDDKLPNIQAAEEAGYRAIHHAEAEATRAKLFEMLARVL
jgi:putative hydrolase of the HAD superfamily